MSTVTFGSFKMRLFRPLLKLVLLQLQARIFGFVQVYIALDKRPQKIWEEMG